MAARNEERQLRRWVRWPGAHEAPRGDVHADVRECDVARGALRERRGAGGAGTPRQWRGAGLSSGSACMLSFRSVSLAQDLATSAELSPLRFAHRKVCDCPE